MVFTVEKELIDKFDAHLLGIKHYAFSVFIFNDSRELLLQKRANSKYHSASLWSNTCCSHPLSSDLDEVRMQSRQRLKEEMGLSSEIDFLFVFEYQEVCGNLIENEHDFVFGGFSSEQIPTFDKSEVSECRWVKLEAILQDVKANPDNYTKWICQSQLCHPCRSYRATFEPPFADRNYALFG